GADASRAGHAPVRLDVRLAQRAQEALGHGAPRRHRRRARVRRTPVRDPRSHRARLPEAAAYPRCTMSDRIVARADDIECRTMDDAVVLLDLRTQRYLSLNRSGAQLWPLIVEGTSEQELVAAIQKHYDLADDVAHHDVRALLTQLRDADLLVEGAG